MNRFNKNGNKDGYWVDVHSFTTYMGHYVNGDSVGVWKHYKKNKDGSLGGLLNKSMHSPTHVLWTIFYNNGCKEYYNNEWIHFEEYYG